MNKLFTIVLGASLVVASGFSQGTRPSDLGASSQPIGDAGIMWYTTWDTALAEATRSKRPIFFMAAAATCSGIPGVFWPGYTSTQNGLFSQKGFIEVSRKFVCVRLESYESKEHQDLIRSLLDGRFENTAFCILDSDGKTRLSGTGRSPNQGLGRRGGDAAVVAKLEEIAGGYQSKGKEEDTILQDFHSFRQALNVASGDQRLLMFVNAPESDQAGIKNTLRPVFADKEIVGRFHLDFADSKTDAEWADVIERTGGKSGFVVIQADQFGQKGEAVAQLPATAQASDIKEALLKANQEFAKSEERKSYSEHVSVGRREGVFFEGGVEYGEDRDGDGEIDHKGGGGGGKGGKGKGGKGKGKGKGRSPE